MKCNKRHGQIHGNGTRVGTRSQVLHRAHRGHSALPLQATVTVSSVEREGGTEHVVVGMLSSTPTRRARAGPTLVGMRQLGPPRSRRRGLFPYFRGKIVLSVSILEYVYSRLSSVSIIRNVEFCACAWQHRPPRRRAPPRARRRHPGAPLHSPVAPGVAVLQHRRYSTRRLERGLPLLRVRPLHEEVARPA